MALLQMDDHYRRSTTDNTTDGSSNTCTDPNNENNSQHEPPSTSTNHTHVVTPLPILMSPLPTTASTTTAFTNKSNNNNNTLIRSHSRTIPFYHRPRVLYGTIFIWLSITGGRFLAPLLQHEGSMTFNSSSSSSSSSISNNSYSNNNTNTHTDSTYSIGLILAIQQFMGIPWNTYAGHITDQYVQQYQNPHLRAMILLGGTFIATISFLFMGLHYIIPINNTNTNNNNITNVWFHHHVLYFIFLRIIYAISLSFILPVLDGLCVHHVSSTITTTTLPPIEKSTTTQCNENPKSDDDIHNDNSENKNDKKENKNTNNYGKERLWGATTWAMTNLLLGPLYDQYGFEISYPASIVAFLLVLISVYLYIQQQPLPPLNLVPPNHVVPTSSILTIPTSQSTKRTKSGSYRRIQSSSSSSQQQQPYEGTSTSNKYPLKSTMINDEEEEEDEPTVRSMDDYDDDDDVEDRDVVANQRDDSDVRPVGIYTKMELLQYLLFASPRNDNHCSDNSNSNNEYSNVMDDSGNSNDDNDDSHTSWSENFPSSMRPSMRPSPQVYYFGCVFIVSIIVLSFGRVIVESLIFLYFEELGSSYLIMGCTVVLTVLFEIPVFAISSSLLQYFGTSHLLRIAMICYIVRVIGYSFIPNGHVQYAFLLEPLHGVTYACSQTAVVDFVHQRIPSGYEATGQSFVYLFRGLGSVLGLIIGGYMTDVIGARMVYRISAMIVSIGCISLSLVRSSTKSNTRSTFKNVQSSPPTERASMTPKRNRHKSDRSSESMIDDENIEMVRSIA